MVHKTDIKYIWNQIYIRITFVSFAYSFAHNLQHFHANEKKCNVVLIPYKFYIGFMYNDITILIYF